MYRLKNSTTYRHRGYDINRGSYLGTSEDSLSGWYVDQADITTLDRRGPGFASLGDAVAHIDRAFDIRADLRGAGTPQRNALNYDTLRLAGRRNREIDDGGLS